MVPGTCARFASLALAASICLGTGCTGVKQYVHNRFKVGPNYAGADATVAETWIDESDKLVRQESSDLSRWWSVFQDPVLDGLIESAQNQNLSLREAGFRVLAARAQLGIVTGNLFPQTQNASGGYRRLNTPVGTPTPVEVGVAQQGLQVILPPNPTPVNAELTDQTLRFNLLSGNNFFDQWNLGFNLAWELDFWGRFRRAIASAEDTVDASVANYDYVLVTLLGDIATTYVQIRTLEKRLEFLRQNVEEQSKMVEIITRIYDAGGDPRKGYPPKRLYDVYQVKSIHAQTEAQIPQLQIERREASNRLCLLLGLPPADLQKLLGASPIPTAPPEVVVGIPADLLRRRPDIRRAERQAAAQAEQIGIAEADFYPMLTINGTLGYQAPEFPQLFTTGAFSGGVGPGFQWNILNYGRIRNNMRLQEAKFQELLTTYQQTVLRANAEVENGLARFLQAQKRASWLDSSADYAEKAVGEIEKLARVGWRGFDANQLAVITQTKVQQQDLQAQAHGEIAQGLILVYRALGGGWESPSFSHDGPLTAPRPAGEQEPEEVPTPTGDAPAQSGQTRSSGDQE